jgi:Tfp pilus assembly protein PilF
VSLGFSELVVANVAEARVAFEKALELDAKQSMAQFGLAQSLALLGEIDAARVHYEKMKAEESVPPSFLEQLGRALGF